MLRKVVRSMNLCASTDIKLTTSPTVDERLAALVITNACRTMMGGRTTVVNTVINVFSVKRNVTSIE